MQYTTMIIYKVIVHRLFTVYVLTLTRPLISGYKYPHKVMLTLPLTKIKSVQVLLQFCILMLQLINDNITAPLKCLYIHLYCCCQTI